MNQLLLFVSRIVQFLLLLVNICFDEVLSRFSFDLLNLLIFNSTDRIFVEGVGEQGCDIFWLIFLSVLSYFIDLIFVDNNDLASSAHFLSQGFEENAVNSDASELCDNIVDELKRKLLGLREYIYKQKI